jgi:hypothetical protein
VNIKDMVVFLAISNRYLAYHKVLVGAFNMYGNRVVLVLTILILGGCASPSRFEKMTISSRDAAIYHGSSILTNSVAVAKVSGGEETNPMWTSEIGSNEFELALIDSLVATKLLALDGKGKYTLSAVMMKVDQPMFGASFTVTSYIHYQLVRNSDNKIIFDQEISSPYTATMSDAFIGVERLKLANEGSARSNITELIDKLYLLKIKPNEVSFNN